MKWKKLLVIFHPFAGMLCQSGGEASSTSEDLEDSSEMFEQSGSGSGDSSEEPFLGKFNQILSAYF